MREVQFVPVDRPRPVELDHEEAAALEGCDPRHVFRGPDCVVAYRRLEKPAPEGSVVSKLIETHVLLHRDGELKTAAVPINESFDKLIVSPEGKRVLARMKIGGIGHVYELDVERWEPRLVITCKKTPERDTRYVGDLDYVDEGTIAVMVDSGKDSHLALIQRQPDGAFEEVDNAKAKATSLVCAGSIVALEEDQKLRIYGVLEGPQLAKLEVITLPGNGWVERDEARETLYFMTRDDAHVIEGAGAGLEKKKPKKPKKGTVVLRRILAHDRPQVASAEESKARFGDDAKDVGRWLRTCDDWLLGEVKRSPKRLFHSPEGELVIREEEPPLQLMDTHPATPGLVLARRGTTLVELDLNAKSEREVGEVEDNAWGSYLQVDGVSLVGVRTRGGVLVFRPGEALGEAVHEVAGPEGGAFRVGLFGRSHVIRQTTGKKEEPIWTLLRLRCSDGVVSSEEVGALVFPGKRYAKLKLMAPLPGGPPHLQVLGSARFYFRVPGI